MVDHASDQVKRKEDWVSQVFPYLQVALEAYQVEVPQVVNLLVPCCLVVNRLVAYCQEAYQEEELGVSYPSFLVMA